jgi:hypothetical protein
MRNPYSIIFTNHPNIDLAAPARGSKENPWLRQEAPPGQRELFGYSERYTIPRAPASSNGSGRQEKSLLGATVAGVDSAKTASSLKIWGYG